MSKLAARSAAKLIPILAMALVSAACGAAGSPSAPPTTSASAPPTTSASATPFPSDLIPPPETTDITIGQSNNLSTNQFIDVFANNLGLFKKYGLNVKIVAFNGAGPVVQALLAGQVQGGDFGGGPVISAALTDTPLVVTTINSATLSYDLLGAKDIKTAADLKGKQIAIGSFGDSSHAVVLAALAQLGLKSSDVTLNAIGSESLRITALLAGSVSAAPVQTVNSTKVIAQGLNLLVDLTKTPLKYDLAGLNFRKDWAAKNTNTILRIIASLLEAEKTLFTNQALAVQQYVAATQLDQATATSAIQACVARDCNKGFRFTVDVFALPLQVTESINAAASTVDLTSIFDLSYLDKLQQLGFNDALQFP